MSIYCKYLADFVRLTQYNINKCRCTGCDRMFCNNECPTFAENNNATREQCRECLGESDTNNATDTNDKFIICGLEKQIAAKSEISSYCKCAGCNGNCSKACTTFRDRFANWKKLYNALEMCRLCHEKTRMVRG